MHGTRAIPGAVLNVATLAALREFEAVTGNRALLDGWVSAFLDESPAILRQLRLAIANHQVEERHRLARQLEQQAAAVGAERVAWAAQRLVGTEAGREGLIRFQLELDRARKSLQALLGAPSWSAAA